MEFTLHFWELCLASGIAALGAILQGCVGFGLGPLAVPLLLLIDTTFVPGPLLVAALFLTILMYRREQFAVEKNEIKWAVAGRLLGTIFGAIVLTVISAAYLSLFFASMVLLSLFIFISGFQLPIKSDSLFSIGALSGFMGTTSSIGGAPMALLYKDTGGPRIRGTLSGIFMIGTVIALASLVVINKFGWHELIYSFTLLPGIFVGYFLSGYVSKILDKGFLRLLILITSGATSITLITRYFIS